MLLHAEQVSFWLIDVQERFMPHMQQAEMLQRQCLALAKIVHALQVPSIVTEQYPKGLGHTVSALMQAMPQGILCVEKLFFSALQVPEVAAFWQQQQHGGRRQVLLAGVEAHVCVLQTALELKEQGADVFVVVDAVSARQASSVHLAEQRMLQAGIVLVNVEMVLTELCRQAGTAQFKQLQQLMKA